MAQKQVTLGSVGPYLYDDATFFGLDTNGKARVQTAPVAADEVVRLGDLPGIAVATTVVTETSFGQASAVGIDTDYARQDHTHGTPTDPVTAHVAAGDPHTQYQKESEKDTSGGYSGYTEATFTITGTGFVSNPTATARYIALGNFIILLVPELTGTSNTTAFTLTGIPAAIDPANVNYQVIRIVDNSVEAVGIIGLGETANVLNVYPTISGGTWTASGTKTIRAIMLAYSLF